MHQTSKYEEGQNQVQTNIKYKTLLGNHYNSVKNKRQNIHLKKFNEFGLDEGSSLQKENS